MGNSKIVNMLRILGAAVIFMAGAFSVSLAGEESLSEFQKQARDYRQEALSLQKDGDYEGALNLLQKSIETDPGYASAHNDIGIIYESLGFLEQAEASYLEAARLSPELPGPYSNLALFYESQNRQEEAIGSWSKRAQVGSDDDPWKKRAQDRFNQLIAEHPEIQDKYVAEESRRLIDAVAEEKRQKKIEEEKESREFYLSSRKHYKNADYLKAMEALDKSLAMDPANSEKLKFKDEVKLAIEKKESVKRAEIELKERRERLSEIKTLSQSGLKAYRENNPAQAEKDFAKVLELIKVAQK